ncbi:MAG: glycoside hydrolase family 32 protein [Bacteroidales bacterium]|nr:glycoside hydrolase family 32 protein [Bacteroidales bacterium]
MKPVRILSFFLTAVFLMSATDSLCAERTMIIEKNYLNIPISQSLPAKALSLRAEGLDPLTVQVRISSEKEDYWVFKDLTRYAGKTLVLTYDGPQEALDRVFQADTICGRSALYREKNRPQYHFTTRRGWINDPNGLVWHDGEYHLFYQHNPYGREWGNMHWGHAVSKDLLHWEEFDDALFPDSLGTMFSGSAVVDRKNSSGFGDRRHPPMVFAYTAAGRRATQCIAYSLDHGRTLVKYEGNPVIDSYERWNSGDTRDPRLLWYAPGKHWVMVLYERDGNSIYTSDNLKDWTWRSHVRGFYECPDLFELPVDGNPENTLWVMLGASGTYMTGTFDGFTFTPTGGKYLYTSGSLYAAQTFSNLPDGRCVQIGWGTMDQGELTPFNCLMLLPTELTLRSTRDGARIASVPVREVKNLFERRYTADGTLNGEEATAAMKGFSGQDGLHIHAILELSYSTSAGLSLNGQNIIDYDTNHNRLCGQLFFAQDPTSLSLEADVYIDRTSVEVFVDGGLFSYSLRRDDGKTEGDLRFWGPGITVRDLQVDTISGIWNK